MPAYFLFVDDFQSVFAFLDLLREDRVGWVLLLDTDEFDLASIAQTVDLLLDDQVLHFQVFV